MGLFLLRLPTTIISPQIITQRLQTHVHRNLSSPTQLLHNRPQLPNTRMLHQHLESESSDPKDNPIADDEPSASSEPSDVLRLMDCLHVPVEADTYADLLRECTEKFDIEEGSLIHAHILKSRFSGSDVLLVANRLLLMYVSCGCPDKARQLFDRMPYRDGFSWATMIAGHSDNGQHEKALRLFVEVVESGSMPGVLCFVAALESCTETGSVVLGRCAHGLVLKTGQGSNSTRLVNSVMKFYSTVEPEALAGPMRSCWVARLALYHKLRMFREVIQVFREMRRNGGSRGGKNKTTTSLVLCIVVKTCGRMMDEGEWHGKQAHAIAIKTRLVAYGVVRSRLVEMYSRLGLVDDARKMLVIMDFECWEAMARGLLS